MGNGDNVSACVSVCARVRACMRVGGGGGRWICAVVMYVCNYILFSVGWMFENNY